MTDKEVYLVKAGTKRIKKISIKKLIDNINLECFNKKFFAESGIWECQYIFKKFEKI